MLAALVFRALQLVAGFIVYYGASAMVTTAGLRPPNAIVVLGLAAVGLTTIAVSRAERRPFASLWVSAVFALSFLLWSISHVSDPACPPGHPPLSATYYCVAPGAQAVLVISAIVLALAIAGAMADVRRLIRVVV